MKHDHEVEIQHLLNKADELRGESKLEAVGEYLAALKLMREYREKDRASADEMWCKKVIFMACNGMGMVYAKHGKITDAVENFQEAIEYAPNDEAKMTAIGNLAKLKEAYEKKTGTRLHII